MVVMDETYSDFQVKLSSLLPGGFEKFSG